MLHDGQRWCVLHDNTPLDANTKALARPKLSHTTPKNTIGRSFHSALWNRLALLRVRQRCRVSIVHYSTPFVEPQGAVGVYRPLRLCKFSVQHCTTTKRLGMSTLAYRTGKVYQRSTGEQLPSRLDGILCHLLSTSGAVLRSRVSCSNHMANPP